MKPLHLLFFGLLLVMAVGAAPPLFTKSTETKWSVTTTGQPVATATLITDGKRLRLEWKSDSKKPAIVFLADPKIWVKSVGGDLELAAYRGGIEKSIAPALLFVDPKGSYRSDAAGPVAIELTSAGKKYVFTRTAVGKPATNDASLYDVRPRKGSAIKMARLAGDLFDTSDGSTAATAGGRGVEKGTAFADGGDYAALDAIEQRDAQWNEKMSVALEEFQKEGKVGNGRGGDE